jgi:ornithine carbamoyltransferase
MKNFINLADIDKKELRKIIDHAKLQKEKKANINNDAPLKGKTLIMIFEKPSTRTRLSFELAMKKLGGDVLVLNPQESHYGSGDESIHDTAKILSQYGDVVMMRTSKHEHFLKFSKHLDIPIINGLTNLSHPVQIMATVMTYEELKGSIANKKIAWLGDGNNVVYSLIEAAAQFDFQLAIACPKKLEPNKKIVKWAKDKKANILITKDPKEAAEDASAVITDKWVSMAEVGVNKKKKKKLLKPYQVNKKIMKLSQPDSLFMHCLPASRGEEVTTEVMDSKQSAVWLEALNRMHVQKSIIQFCLNLL